MLDFSTLVIKPPFSQRFSLNSHPPLAWADLLEFLPLDVQQSLVVVVLVSAAG